MSSKSILHLTGMKSTKYGGLENYFVELTRLCNKKGYRSILQFDFLPQSSDYLLHLESLGAKIVIFNTGRNLLKSSLKTASLIRSVKPKVVQTHFIGGKLAFVIGVVGRVLRIPKTIAMIHSNLDLKKNSRTRYALNNFHHVLAVSQAVAQNLIEGGVSPTIVREHYLGLFGEREPSIQVRSQLRLEFGISNEAVVICSIAFDAPVKGLDILLNSLSKVLQKYPFVYLVLVGIDPQKSYLPELAAKLSLSNNVQWVGIRDEAWRILNVANIYIQPSRSEGLPLTILEAMAFKLPVVATRVGGIPEAVIDGETGYLADQADADSLYDAIDKMLAQPQKWRAMGDAGYLRYQQLFKGENSIRTLVEKYFEV